MSRLIAQLLLSMLLFPLAGVLYVVVFVVHEETRGWGREEVGFLLAGVVIWAFMAIYWSALWRKGVVWTPQRTRRTLFSSVIAAFGGLIAGISTAPIDEGFGCFVGSVTAPLLWLVGTVLVWRETAAERADRLARSGADGIVCPTCGYNLTGLKGSRCPECGSEFTLDQLLASQPGKASAELEV